MGFSHASNVASFECLDFGVATCGSVIVPSPWFLETALTCRNNPSYDVGVHLSLTCEYELYRWRALSSTDPNTGLLDHEGCLWRTADEAIENVKRLTGFNKYDNPYQLRALSHFVYCLGAGSLEKSTMLSNIRKGWAIDYEIMKWTWIKSRNGWLNSSYLKKMRLYELTLYKHKT